MATRKEKFSRNEKVTVGCKQEREKLKKLSATSLGTYHSNNNGAIEVVRSRDLWHSYEHPLPRPLYKS